MHNFSTEVIHPDVNNLHGLLLLDVLAVHRVVDLKLTWPWCCYKCRNYKKDCDVNHHHHSISHPSLRKVQLKWYILMSANSLVVSSLLSLLSTVSSTTTSYVLHIVRHVESIKNFMSAPITTAYDILVEENSTEVIHSICQLPPWSSPPGCPCRPGCH